MLGPGNLRGAVPGLGCTCVGLYLGWAVPGLTCTCVGLYLDQAGTCVGLSVPGHTRVYLDMLSLLVKQQVCVYC